MKSLLFLISLLFILVSCEIPFFGDDEESTGSYTSAGLSNGYGGTYTLDLMSDYTFELSELDNDGDANWTAKGSYQALDSGFKLLTVSSSSGSSDGPSSGDTAYGLDIEGLVFFLKPIGDGSELIAMVKSGSCPESNQTLNWVTVNKNENTHLSNGDDSNACDASSGATNGADIFGTFAWNSSTNIASLPKKYDICRNDLGPGDVNDGNAVTCSDGVVSITGAKMFLTESGGAIVAAHNETDSGDDDEIYLALPSTSLTMSSLAGDYVGLLFAKDDSDEDTNPIKATVNSTGDSITVNDVDPSTGSTGSDISGTLSVDGSNLPSAGFFYGTVDAGSDSNQQDRKVVCMANTDVSGSGKNFISCIGQVPGDSTKGEMYSILLISK